MECGFLFGVKGVLDFCDGFGEWCNDWFELVEICLLVLGWVFWFICDCDVLSIVLLVKVILGIFWWCSCFVKMIFLGLEVGGCSWEELLFYGVEGCNGDDKWRVVIWKDKGDCK